MKRVHLFISGRVQGVCFRIETKIRANKLGLNGFVRNLENGRVELAIEGKEEKVNKLVEWAKRGPMFAKVTDMQIAEEKYPGDFKEFKILY